MFIEDAFKIIKQMEFHDFQNPTLEQVHAIYVAYRNVKEIELKRKVISIVNEGLQIGCFAEKPNFKHVV